MYDKLHKIIDYKCSNKTNFTEFHCIIIKNKQNFVPKVKKYKGLNPEIIPVIDDYIVLKLFCMKLMTRFLI